MLQPTWLCVSMGAYTCPREAAGECVPACARPRGVRVADAHVICGEDAPPTRLDLRFAPWFSWVCPWVASGRLSCRDSEPVTVAHPEQTQQIGCIGVLVFPSPDTTRVLPVSFKLPSPLSPVLDWEPGGGHPKTQVPGQAGLSRQGDFRLKINGETELLIILLGGRWR